MLIDHRSGHHLVWLSGSPVPRSLVGGKGESLSRLAVLGAPVPTAFALSTAVYAEFARAIGLPERACDAPDAALPGIRSAIEGSPLPSSVSALLREGLAAIAANRPHPPSLAVRSSATTEDSAEYSFAGLHDTVLDVRDLSGLEVAVRRCWASLWSDRSVDYRRRKGLADVTAEIAVVVQELVASDVSFVVFTADPVSGNDDHLVIAATWGLGEAVVSGLVVPDHIVIGPNGNILEYTVGEKSVMVIPSGIDGHGAREVPVPRVLRGAPVLTERQAVEIGAIARRISAGLGFKTDIEGAIAGGTIYLLQARPITTLPPESVAPQVVDDAAPAARESAQEERTAMATTVARRLETFPTDWNAAAEDGTTFMFDPMHFPFPLTPLTVSTLNPAFATGFTAAAREMNTPIEQVRVVDSNWYRFEQFAMRQPASDDAARAMGELAEATLKPEIGRLEERWRTEHLPALRAHLQRLAEVADRVPDASASEIAGFIDESADIHRDLWTIHFRVAIPMLLGMQLYDEFYADVFGGAASDAHALLLGVSSESVKAGHGLYDLAVLAQDLGLEPLFRMTPADRLVAALEQSEAGRTFLAKLADYLERYGLRQDLFDVATPTWRENPTIALSSVRNYVQTGRDERAEYADKVRSAEEAIAAARAQLASYPEAVRGQFEGLLQAARTASFLQEEHNFYIDQQGLARLHLFFVAIGRRMVERGVIEQADDVFLLRHDELRAVFSDGGTAPQLDRVRSLVERRREEMAIARTLTPPSFIGAPPAGAPPDSPMTRAMGRFFGGPPQETGSSNELKGNAGSRGVATGIAKVARTLEEAAVLKPGEILVTVTTMPPWTPLFGIAAAVVTETGGPLSHCAIVAREYGIPAVVGAHGATLRIVDGQRITVDGGRGIVQLDA